jgi:hypothetical protein
MREKTASSIRPALAVIGKLPLCGNIGCAVFPQGNRMMGVK